MDEQFRSTIRRIHAAGLFEEMIEELLEMQDYQMLLNLQVKIDHAKRTYRLRQIEEAIDGGESVKDQFDCRVYFIEHGEEPYWTVEALSFKDGVLRMGTPPEGICDRATRISVSKGNFSFGLFPWSGVPVLDFNRLKEVACSMH